MSILSNIVRQISAPVAKVASLVPTPEGQIVSFVSGQIAQDTAKRDFKREVEEARRQNMELFGARQSIPTIQANLARTTPVLSTQSSGGGFFDTITGGLKNVAGFVSDVFSTGVPQLLGVQRPAGVAQQPAVTSVTNIGAQESQGSGSIQAGAGALLPSILGGARSLLKTPAGQLALGGGTALATGMLGGDGKQMRITRKMKSQARMVLNMTGGNLSATADMLGIDQNTLVMILLKRFRNDGPVVTKAALRKTKQTIRRLHSMQDVLKSITPTATMRRRAPMKRATTTTLIKN